MLRYMGGKIALDGSFLKKGKAPSFFNVGYAVMIVVYRNGGLKRVIDKIRSRADLCEGDI